MSLLLFLLKVWDRRQLNESCPYPVGILAGHSDGITHIDPRVTKKLTLLVIDKKYSIYHRGIYGLKKEIKEILAACLGPIAAYKENHVQ